MTAARRRAAGLTLAGLAFLALGVLVYLADRAPLAALLALHVPGVSGARWFGSAADWLPALAHTAGFGLLTAAVLPPRGPWALMGCVFWGLVDVVAEIGQVPGVDQALATLLLDTLGDGRAVAFVARYFTLGTFDPLDVVAAIAGTLVAALVCRVWRLPDAAPPRPPAPASH